MSKSSSSKKPPILPNNSNAEISETDKNKTNLEDLQYPISDDALKNIINYSQPYSPTTHGKSYNRHDFSQHSTDSRDNSQQLRLDDSTSTNSSSIGERTLTLIKAYKEYYSSGAYGSRYQDQVNLRDKEIITRTISKILIKKIKKLPTVEQYAHINILDFGCGDGRYFPVIENLVSDLDKLAKKNGKKLKLTYIGSDPIEEAMVSFSEKIKARKKYNNNKSEPISTNNIERQFYSSTLLDIALLTNDLTNSSNKDLFSVIKEKSTNKDGSIDLVMSMYGVLSHIKQKPRKEVISSFYNIMNDDSEIIITLPNIEKRFLKEQEESKSYKDGDKGVKGDIEYYRGEIGPIFYHLYNTNEIRKEFRDFDLIGKTVGISHTIDEMESVRDYGKSRADRMISLGLLPIDKKDEYLAIYQKYRNGVIEALKLTSLYALNAEEIKDHSDQLNHYIDSIMMRILKRDIVYSGYKDHYDQYQKDVKALLNYQSKQESEINPETQAQYFLVVGQKMNLAKVIGNNKENDLKEQKQNETSNDIVISEVISQAFNSFGQSHKKDEKHFPAVKVDISTMAITVMLSDWDNQSTADISRKEAAFKISQSLKDVGFTCEINGNAKSNDIISIKYDKAPSYNKKNIEITIPSHVLEQADFLEKFKVCNFSQPEKPKTPVRNPTSTQINSVFSCGKVPD